MIPPEEESFPRGRRKVTAPLKRAAKADDNLFGTKHAPKSKKAKSNHVKQPQGLLTEDGFQNALKISGSLSYQKVQDGTLILGCVRHVTNFSLELEFPGLIFGKVSITNISDQFTQYLNKKLSETDDNEEPDFVLKNMFNVGQLILAKVLSIDQTEKGFKIDASLNPKDVNNGKNHNSFKKNMLLWACVQSVLDHGYELSVGVKNCRVFLPTENVDKGKTYAIGEPLWCVVHKYTDSNIASTLRVSAKQEHLNSTKTEEIDSLHDIIPGMQVDLVTEKVIDSGIQGKFLEDYFGYVNENYLKKPLQKVQDFQEGKLLKAYVLYVEPATKITHLTLRSLDMYSAAVYNTGDVVKAEVLYKTKHGLYFKLPEDKKGFTTNKRLLKTLPKSHSLELSSAILSKFPAGSHHNCRILDYNFLSQMYVVTVEQSLVKQNLFTIKDIELGKLLNVKIEAIKPEGLVVSAGAIRGFVPNFHLSNVQFSENIKKRFTVGSKLNARVLEITEEGNVLFTLKQGLVDSDICLTSITNLKPKVRYPGVIIKTSAFGALVAFYGNVKGKINKKRLDCEENVVNVDPQKYFYRGQVVNVWVLGVYKEQLVLSLKEPTGNENITNKVKIGDTTTGVITQIHEDKIDVKSANGKVIGCIPVNHLSPGLDLCKPLLKTYKIGDKIKDLLCVNSEVFPAILSRREGLRIKNKSKIKKFDQLKRGNVVRCFYESDDQLGIYVTVLTRDYHEKVLIKKGNIHVQDHSQQKFQHHQAILAKVLNIDKNARKLTLSTKINVSVEYTINLFGQYLSDIQHLRDFGKKHSWLHCQYDPGERVKCTVKNVTKLGSVVTLPNGCNGLVPKQLCPNDLKEGKTIEGVILAQDFADGYLEVCLDSHFSSKINDDQDIAVDIKEKASCSVEKLLQKKDYLLAVLKQAECSRQLVYIPLRLSENDFVTSASHYLKNKIKICVCGKVKNHLIGMSRKLFIQLEREKNKTNLEILKRKNNNSTEDTGVNIKEEDGNSDEDDALSDVENGDETSDIENEDEETSDIENEEDETSDVENEEDSNVEDEEDETSDVENEEDESSDVENENDESLDAENEDSIDEINGENDSSSEDEKISSEVVSRKRKLENSSNTDKSILPGVSSFFNTKETPKTVDESSSDEEEEGEMIKKKKKLSRTERAEQLRLEEERIFQIEKRFADNSVEPESADDFDRLLLANPNSSELWTRYMAFHISSTEIDKARSVAKRALENINMTEVQEKFNIWIALLHLENSYGNRETFDKVFDEAVKCNDSLQVYLKVIEMLADNGKLSDMEEKIKKVRARHKQEPTMWIEVGKIYYKIKKFKEARNINDAALKSISDKKTQMNIIIRFAIMEFKYGEEQQGAAIFESILNTDPRKVNIWFTYVDQLIKLGRIEQTRKVLERSVCQRLPVRSMKSLFLKFRKFEEQYGTPETVEAVKQKAQEYISKTDK